MLAGNKKIYNIILVTVKNPNLFIKMIYTIPFQPKGDASSEVMLSAVPLAVVDASICGIFDQFLEILFFIYLNILEKQLYLPNFF